VVLPAPVDLKIAPGPAFLAEAAKLQLEVSPMTGEAVQAIVAELANTPPEIAQRVRDALEAPAAK